MGGAGCGRATCAVLCGLLHPTHNVEPGRCRPPALPPVQLAKYKRVTARLKEVLDETRTQLASSVDECNTLVGACAAVCLLAPPSLFLLLPLSSVTS